MAEKPVETVVEETNSEKTVPELKEEADQDACLKPFTIMTMNMNGKACGKGSAKVRNTLILKFIRKSSPSVIFCQELPELQDYFKKEVVEKCGTGSYNCHCTEKEAAVIWRESDFYGDPVIGTDSSIKKIVEKLQRKRSDIDVSEACTRTAMVNLTSLRTSDGTEAPFLAVSWHGPSTESLYNKRRKLKGLIHFVHEVCEEKNLNSSSFFIGVDFNLKTLLKDIRIDLEQHGVTVRHYDLCTRDQKKLRKKKGPGRPFTTYKDNFVFTRTGNITASEVKTLEFEDSEVPGSDVVKEDHAELEDQRDKTMKRENILDHAPVVGVLKLKQVTGK